MNITDFSEPQRRALLDLLVLAMYMDGSLASAEETRVQQLLTAMGLDSPHDRNREFDAAVNRVRPHSESAESARGCVATLAPGFATREHQHRVCDILTDLAASDGKISPQEEAFLSCVREAFKL